MFEEKEQRESPSCDVGPRGSDGFLVVIKCSATYTVRLRGEEKEEEKRRDREERRVGTDGHEATRNNDIIASPPAVCECVFAVRNTRNVSRTGDPG